MQPKSAQQIILKLQEIDRLDIIAQKNIDPIGIVLGIHNSANDMFIILYSDQDVDALFRFIFANELLQNPSVKDISSIYTMLNFIVEENNYVLNKIAQELKVEEDLVNKWMSIQSKKEMNELMTQTNKKKIKNVFIQYLQKSPYAG